MEQTAVEAAKGRSRSGVVRAEYFRSVLLTYTKREESCILGDPVQHKIPPHTLALLITLGDREGWLCGCHLQTMAESYRGLFSAHTLSTAWSTEPLAS